jgi:hypothetical protein
MSYKVLENGIERDATPEEVAEIEARASEQVPPVPNSVTMRQARLALLGAGLLGQVSTAIASLSSPHREQAEIEWEFSSDVYRDRPLVAMLGPQLGLTNEQLDQLFITAATL